MQEATLGPAWTYDKEVEAPAAEKDMGGWTMGVYTEEQQTRLNVDELGETVCRKNSPVAITHSRVPTGAASEIPAYQLYRRR